MRVEAEVATGSMTSGAQLSVRKKKEKGGILPRLGFEPLTCWGADRSANHWARMLFVIGSGVPVV